MRKYCPCKWNWTSASARGSTLYAFHNREYTCAAASMKRTIVSRPHLGEGQGEGEGEGEGEGDGEGEGEGDGEGEG